MNLIDKVAVCSRSFSANRELRAELLSRYKYVRFNDEGKSLQGDELKNFLSNCSKAIIGLEVLDSNILKELPKLEVVSKYGVGIDMIDLTAFERHGIRLGWKAGVNKRSVSELVIALSLSLLRNICVANYEVKTGRWNQFKGNLLSGKTFGIIGFGNIGRDLSKLLRPFKCKILVYDKYEIDNFCHDSPIKQTNLNLLLKNSDIVSLHTPLTSQTENFIGERELALMKKNAILINTSRGNLVDEIALLNYLKSGSIGGAALDVFSEEPPGKNALLDLKNFICTPHIAGTTKETIFEMGMAAIDGLDNAKSIGKL